MCSFVSSNSAYFLTYTRKGRKIVAQPTVPENLKAIIELQSNEFELEAEQDRTKRNQVIENKTGHQKMFEKLWKDIAVMDPSVSSKCYWISLDWLKSWIKGECEVQEKPIDNTSLVCRHEKLDPRKLASAKRINPVSSGYFCIFRSILIATCNRTSGMCCTRSTKAVQN